MGAARPGEPAARLQIPSVTTSPTPTTRRSWPAARRADQRRAGRATGWPPYQFDVAVAAVAAAHSADQASRRTMSHAAPTDERRPALTRHGVTWGTWAENVGAGFNEPAPLLQAWLASPTHRPAVLSSNFTRIGVGVATPTDGTRYWTMIVVG